MNALVLAFAKQSNQCNKLKWNHAPSGKGSSCLEGNQNNKKYFLFNILTDEEEASEVSEEWKRIAYVLDWICFWIFGISILITTITIFVQGSVAGVASLESKRPYKATKKSWFLITVHVCVIKIMIL